MKNCGQNTCTIVPYSSYLNAEQLGCAQTWLKPLAWSCLTHSKLCVQAGQTSRVLKNALGLSPFWGSWDHTEFSRSISSVKIKLMVWGRQSRGRVEYQNIFSSVIFYLYKRMATAWDCEEKSWELRK